MSANYKITTPKEFFSLNKSVLNDSSFLDQLSSTLKNSFSLIWDSFKSIDIKNILTQSASKVQVSTENSKNKKNNKKKYSPLNKNDRQNDSSTREQNSGIKTEDLCSKRQMLKQKKQRKKICFEEYEKQQQKKLNESFIRKKIQTKKALNRSAIQNQRQNSALFVCQPVEQIGINRDDSRVTTQQKSSLALGSQLKKDHSAFKHTSNNVLNQSILNVSEIDSQCNFNILNNSLRQESAKGYHKSENSPQDYNLYGLQQGQEQLNIPKLDLKEYPYPLLTGNLQSRLNRQKPAKTKSKQSRKQMPPVSRHHQYIDVDGDDTHRRRQHPLQVDLQDQYRQQGQVRKRVKHTFDNQCYEQNQQLDPKVIQKYQRFDRLVHKRYDRVIEQTLISAQQSQKLSNQQKQPLKEQFQRFIARNFSAMKDQKGKVEKSFRTTYPVCQDHRFQGSLEPADLYPQIQRKKLYHFTKQCQSKISVQNQFKKSVVEDKQRQQHEQIRRRQEQQRKAKMQLDLERERLQRHARQQEQAHRMNLLQEEERTRKMQQVQQQQELIPQNQVKQSNEVGGEVSDQASINLQYDQKESQKAQPNQGPTFTPKISLFNLGEVKAPQASQKQKQISRQKLVDIQKKDSTVQKQSQQTQKPKEFTLTSRAPQVQTPRAPQVQTCIVQGKQPKNPVVKKPNPFLQLPKNSPNAPTLLQNLINSKKDQGMFKSSLPSPLNSPSRQPNSSVTGSFLSPVRNPSLNLNTSHCSNALDSSMCQQSQSNITPGNSQFLNNIQPNQNLNGSFLNNNSFTSSTNNNIFQNNSNSLFNIGSNFNQIPASGLFGNPQSINTPNSLFANKGNSFINGMPPQTSNPMTKFEAVNQIPSFMQNRSTQLSNQISAQNAVSLFSQKSPSKNQPTSLFAPTPAASNERKALDNRRKKKQERIR